MESNYKMIHISVNKLCPDMILAKDVVTKNGVVVLTKNTKLDDSTYKKLEKNGDIRAVEIWEYSIDENIKPFNSNNENLESSKKAHPILDKPDFKRFQETYDKKIYELKGCIDGLKNGNNANHEELYGIIDSIVGTANCSSDLVQYINYISKMDDTTYAHSINVAVLAHLCATWLRLDEKDVEKTTVAGLLHDIGKTVLGLSEKELSHEDYLVGEKLFKFRSHPEVGYNLLLNQNLYDDVKQAVLTHHEKIDGSGYPNGLKDDKINLISKIVAVCNEYDNLVYLKKRCPFDIINEFEHMYLGLLDTKILMQFTKNIACTYISSYVRLSDERIAQIVFINPNFPSLPVVSLSDGTLIDLFHEKNLKIVSMASS